MLTQEEVATLLGITTRAVRGIERRAVEKLRHHPALRRLWQEWTGGAPPSVEEAAYDLISQSIKPFVTAAKPAVFRKVLRVFIW